MSVVQRCPNCGTTRATPGECEACHEAQVRYFCTNHNPGVWLDGPACSKCGSRWGDPPSRAAVPAPIRPLRTRPRAPERLHEREREPEREPAREREREPAPVRAFPPVSEDGLELGAPPMPMWQQILRAAIRARYMSRAVAVPERPPIGRGVGGCLVRLVMVVLFLTLALVSVFFQGWARF